MPGADDNKEDDLNKDLNNQDPGDQGDKDNKGDPGPGDKDQNKEGTAPKTLEEALAVVEKLRKENAKSRVKNKSLEENLGKYDGELKKVKEALGIKDESEDPKVQISTLQGSLESMKVELSMVQLARENAIPPSQDKYFKFLLAEKFEELKDGEELSDEALEEVISQVKLVSGSGAPKKTTTGQGGKTPDDEAKGGVTMEQFAQMSLAERSALYGKNPQVYTDLMSRARAARLIK